MKNIDQKTLNKIHNTQGLEYVPYERTLVQMVDYLVEIARKNESKGSIRREQDWDTLEHIINAWSAFYPDWSAQFLSHMKDIRAHSNTTATAREGEAMIQHQLEVPEKLMLMIKVIFPDQKWDKKFVAKFVKRFKGFAGGDKL